MKWLNDMKEGGAILKEWGRLLTVTGMVMAGALVAIAVELLVICIKM